MAASVSGTGGGGQTPGQTPNGGVHGTSSHNQVDMMLHVAPNPTNQEGCRQPKRCIWGGEGSGQYTENFIDLSRGGI